MPRIPLLVAVLATAFTLLPACASEPRVDPVKVRVATFNIAMGLEQAGDMARALESGDDERLHALATILQSVRPDIVLLQEFDYDPGVDASGQLHRNYLLLPHDGLDPIEYPYSFRPPVNTGVPSGLDIDGNGRTGDPGDAWGFGHFPGEYGMLILSRYPIYEDSIRSFQLFPWSEFPNARRPTNEDGTPYNPDEVWSQMRLSSKNHLDIPLQVNYRILHLLVSHPTPPVFDGPEDRNGRRNFNEIGFWSHYISQPGAGWIRDDGDGLGGLAPGESFVILGDLNADPNDGDSTTGAIRQLLAHPGIDANCTPASAGGAEASEHQKGVNTGHTGNPAHDTADFGDDSVGNLRLDYVLPSNDIQTIDCGVFWPAQAEAHHDSVRFSDHRLTWADILL